MKSVTNNIMDTKRNRPAGVLLLHDRMGKTVAAVPPGEKVSVPDEVTAEGRVKAAEDLRRLRDQRRDSRPSGEGERHDRRG